MAKSQAERARDLRASRKANGLVELRVFVHPLQADALKVLIGMLRHNPRFEPKSIAGMNHGQFPVAFQLGRDFVNKRPLVILDAEEGHD